MKEKKHLYTAAELFLVVMDQLREESKVPDGLLDYALPTADRYDLRDYGFDVLGCVNYGSSEGIYIDLFFRGDIGDPQSRMQGEIGTIKTLERSDEAFRQMAILMADFQIAATLFLNSNLDDFTWVGFDIDYYRHGSDKPCYGITCKGYKTLSQAVQEAKRTLEAYRDKYQYEYAVVTNNSTGKFETVSLTQRQTSATKEKNQEKETTT